jgi:RNA polymerase sigma-70 factor, ECF subfamily
VSIEQSHQTAFLQGLEAFRSALPDARVEDAAVLEHAQRCDSVRQEAGTRPWQKERAFEVCLAFAVTKGDAVAIAHFQKAYGHEFERSVARFSTLVPMRDDLRQRFWEKLSSGESPALLNYSGMGPLGAWLSAAATRLALNAVTREQREVPTEQTFFDAVVATEPDAERAYLKLTSRASLQAAFERAAQSLDAKERNLLKFAFIDHLNVDQIAAFFDVHRATAARWVAAARERLVQRTHAELIASLHVSDEDAASIVRAGLSGIGFTFLGALKAEAS